MKKLIVVMLMISLLPLISGAEIEATNPGISIQRIVSLDPITSAISSFLGLDDTPSSYSGEGGNCVLVNGGEDGLEFGSCGGGGGSGAGDKWVDIGSFIIPNTTFADDIRVQLIEAFDWSNVTITESQINDLTHDGTASWSNNSENVTTPLNITDQDSIYFLNGVRMDGSIPDFLRVHGSIAARDNISVGDTLGFVGEGRFLNDTDDYTIQDFLAKRTDSEITSLINQVYIIALGFVTGTDIWAAISGNRTEIEAIIDTVNTTANIESLNFTQGPHIFDGNASSICTAGEYLDGGGSCISFNSTVQDLSLNQTEADLLYLNLSGTNANQNINISPYNLQLNNLTVIASINQDNYTIRSVSMGGKTIDDVFCLEMNSPDGGRRCKLVVQPGGSGQASIIRRSFATVNDDVCTGVNATNMQCYADVGGFTWNIDFNTSVSGADMGVLDDLEVIGDIWLRDTEGEPHFFSRELQLIDELHANILFNRIDSGIDGTDLIITSRINKTIVVNINSTNTIFTANNDSVTLTTGTNITPAFNHVSYQNQDNPTLTIDSTIPTILHADIAKIYVGDAANQIYMFDTFVAHNDEFINLVYDRFDDAGAIYSSGLDIDVNESDFNITNGEVKIRLDEEKYSNDVDSVNRNYFLINSSGNFVEGTAIADLGEYATGETVSNNKYFNIVVGVVPINQTTMRMMIIIQDKPAVEYGSLISAEADTFQTINFFPNDEHLKKVFVPVFRGIIKQVAGDNEFQVLNDGLRYFDIRGQVTATSGAPSAPPITNHDELDNLDAASSGHTGFLFTTDETNLNVNSSDFWDNLDIFNSTQMENAGSVLSIKVSWFISLFDDLFSGKDTDDLTEGSTNKYDNVSWNQETAEGLFNNASLDNVAFENESNVFTLNQTFNVNITVLERVCFNADCSSWIGNNGTDLIGVG